MSKPLYWYRPSPFSKIITISIICGSIMMLSVIVVGAGLDTSGRVPKSLQSYLLIFGMIGVIGAVSSAAFGYYRTIMQDNTVLLLSTEGLSFQSNHREEFIAWKKLQTIQLQRHQIIIQCQHRQVELPAFDPQHHVREGTEI